MTMLTIPGYRITQQLYSGSRTLVYRGFCESDQQPVVLKLLKSEYPTFNELVQFRNQYTIAKNLDLPGIVKHLSLENYSNSFVLVIEDFGGVSLADYITSSRERDKSLFLIPSSLNEFLNIAIHVSKILEGLYRNRIIHKDIKPQNILINPETQQVKLIDFSIASLLPSEFQEIQNPNVLEGTLAYMSPEQTGRMNRGIDYRTDFYSLGVTFYELLTGQLPFQSTDPMELVHCHIARIPTPVIEVNSAIPQILNDIVMKLMAKTAEDRYQTAFGIKYDLEICLEQHSAKGSIAPFELGVRDIADRFVIPEKLYGRKTEVATLLAAFDRVSAGATEIMLVAGFSGIGKTAVVNEVHKPIVRQRGYFIKGKFDQFKRDIPFFAWVQAFQNLMRQLLTESTVSLAQWKANILAALGETGQVIIDVIPELELLIGKQHFVAALEGSAAQNRFNLLFRKFIQVFTTPEHPLVIFLDDLQWADSASLRLMQLLMSETDTCYLLLMGAYRDNEVSPAHPLMLTLDEICKTNVTVNQITLAPLDYPSLNHLIADTLSCPPQKAVPLTELVFTKTKGNPFFSNQFLKSLYEDQLISFDFDCSYWQCNITQVKALTLTNDVVEFIALQLQKLPINTQTVLKLAACVGNHFDLATLAIVYEKSQVETAADLWKALLEGVVIPITEIYKFFQDEAEVSRNNGEEQTTELGQRTVPYRFLHDRVQQAAYFLIPEDQKQVTHLKIGRLLLSNIPVEEREEKIFDIVNQLNLGLNLITLQSERDELAKLNLIAGRKAKASTAYTAAVRYFAVGTKLLAASSWQSQYDLMLALYESAASAAFLCGEFEQMEQLVDVVLQQAKTLLDKVRVYEVKIQACIAQNKMLEAVNTALPVLKLLEVEFPHKPSQSDIQLGLEETTSNLSQGVIADLINLPKMTDPHKLAAMQILSSVFAAAYIAVPELMLLTVLKQVNLSLQYGNAYESAYAYATYGLILCGVVGDIDSGYQFGKLALNILEKFQATKIKSKTLAVVNAAIKHWKDHIRETLKLLQDAYYSGLETGDLEFASHGAYIYCFHSYCIGKELVGLEREMAIYSEALNQLKQATNFNYHKIYRQSVLNLLGRAENPCSLIGESYDERSSLPLHLLANDRYAICDLSVNKLLLCYLFGNYKQAVEAAIMAEKYLDGATATPLISLFHFYDSLARLAVYPDTQALVGESEAAVAANSPQNYLLSKVSANQEKMRKWADHAPMNYLHKFCLVEAEKYRILGQNTEAMDYYDRAIVGAKENEYTHEEALANELAAKFYLEWGKEKIARTYLTDAYYAYACWGAKAKVEDLEQRYPQLLAPILKEKVAYPLGETITQMTTGTFTSTSSRISEILDLATVMKASQALSGEIQLNQLLSTLMQVVIENAGATKCALILQKVGKLIIEVIAVGVGEATKATQMIDTPDIKPASTVLQSTPLEESQDIPVSAINYVWRTQETLVLNNVLDQQEIPLLFATDSYIIQQLPKSLLCTPIQTQGKLIGLLYLENNLTQDAFTPERLEVLKVLSSQAAISLENVRLYGNLEEYNHTLETKVEERTQELSQALEHLKATQEELIQSEKMAALGQLIAGIAHEINTPLGAIHSSAGNISKFLNQTLEQLPTLFQSLSPEQGQDFLALLQRSLQQEIMFSTKEERKFKRALKIQLEALHIDNTEQIADTLVTMGIYNEIDAFIPLFTRPDSLHLLEIAYKVTELKRGIFTINTATERASKVVYALKSYARYDHSGEMTTADLIEGIETVLTLYQNQFKQGVEVIRNYTELPPLLCYPDELNQVWTNLIHNALQAMDNRGILTVDVTQQDQQMKIAITDTGKGIADEIKSKIFEPFFTTKALGEGSGLGLDIANKIIAKHSGKVTVESQPGQTTFNVFLPIRSV